MLPYILNTEHYHISSYGVLFFAGYVFCSLLACLYAKRSKSEIRQIDIVLTSCFSIFGIGIGAKLFYFLSVFPNVLKHLDTFNKFTFFEKINYLFSGMVFFGGLIGAIITTIIFSKLQGFDLGGMFRVIVPYYPLIHAFGRVGCFLAGCCYGVEYDGIFSVVLKFGTGAGVPRFPVQLLEALFNVCVFIVLLLIRKYSKFSGKALLCSYLVIYSVGRFLLEFLRGDKIRGVYGFISTSQIISLVLIVLCVGYSVFAKITNPINKTC